MTSKRIAKKASELGRKAKTYAEREIAMSALSQAKRLRKKRVERESAQFRRRSPSNSDYIHVT